MFPTFIFLYPDHLFFPAQNQTKHIDHNADVDHLRSIHIGTCQDVTKTILHLPLCKNLLGAHLVHYISPRSTYVLPARDNFLGAPHVLHDLIISTWEHTHIYRYICKDWLRTKNLLHQDFYVLGQPQGLITSEQPASWIFVRWNLSPPVDSKVFHWLEWFKSRKNRG